MRRELLRQNKAFLHSVRASRIINFIREKEVFAVEKYACKLRRYTYMLEYIKTQIF